jgi:low affinity Fe/Cu permease
MKKYYHAAERTFESISEKSLAVFGNSITFIIICFLVAYWIAESIVIRENMHDLLRDIILGISFLSFFIIQKSLNRYSKALHVKLNELVLTNENASNEIVNAEKKTEVELETLKKKYEEHSGDTSER